MVSPQLETGHIRIANDFWDAWCKTGSPRERVFKAIVRYTWGWNKKQAPITQQQIGDLTGLVDANGKPLRPQISRATSQLAASKMILRISVWGETSEYAIQKDFEEWTIACADNSISEFSTIQRDNSSTGQPDNSLAVSVIQPDNSSTIPTGNSSTIQPDNIHIKTIKAMESHVSLPPKDKNLEIVAHGGFGDIPEDSRGSPDPVRKLFCELWIPHKLPPEAAFADYADLVRDYGASEVLAALQEAEIGHAVRHRAIPYARSVLERRRKEKSNGRSSALRRKFKPTSYGM